MAEIFVPQAAECRGEVCSYSQDGKCTYINRPCSGKRADALLNNCYEYLAEVNNGDDNIVRKPDFGFVSYRQFSSAGKIVERKASLKMQLKALKDLKACLGERGLQKIKDLKKILGEEESK